MKKIILTALFMGILLGGHARNTASPFQAVVAQDGSGDYTSIQAAIDAVRQLSLDVNIPQTLHEIGVKEDDLEDLAHAAMADVCTGGNPRPCTFELVLEVYKNAF